MGLLFRQSQNTILRVTKEEKDFIENRTDLTKKSRSFDIEIDFLKNEDEHIIVFHNGEQHTEELYDEFSGKKMYTPVYMEEDRDVFEKRVQKLLTETKVKNVNDPNVPDLKEMAKNLGAVKNRFFCC